ncbi:MAG: hypothetical protein JOZ58_28330 [Acetobacteraceae bacterium]|nr:hypothetical protein [Acetobacteraceae bacterium]
MPGWIIVRRAPNFRPGSTHDQGPAGQQISPHGHGIEPSHVAHRVAVVD